MKLLCKVFLTYLLLPMTLAYGNQPILFTVNELLNGKQLYDGLVIQFQGEVIGQRLSRTSQVWINILDHEGNAIGASMSRELSNSIQHYGTYKTNGDKVLIEGIFHTKCEEHGGDTDIHVKTLRVLQVGGPRQTDQVKHILLIGSFILLVYSFFLLYIKRRRAKESE